MGPTACPQTSVNNYQLRLRNIQEERKNPTFYAGPQKQSTTVKMGKRAAHTHTHARTHHTRARHTHTHTHTVYRTTNLKDTTQRYYENYSAVLPVFTAEFLDSTATFMLVCFTNTNKIQFNNLNVTVAIIYFF
jgi:ABC-type nickel/cobalt efflux system permease component RcnA